MTPKERVIAALEHREPDMDYSPLFSFPFAPFFSSLLPFFPVRQFGYGGNTDVPISDMMSRIIVPEGEEFR